MRAYCVAGEVIDNTVLGQGLVTVDVECLTASPANQIIVENGVLNRDVEEWYT